MYNAKYYISPKNFSYYLSAHTNKKNEAQTTYQIDIKNLRTQQTFKKDFFNAITKFILIIGSFGVGLSIIKAIVSSSEEIASLLI